MRVSHCKINQNVQAQKIPTFCFTFYTVEPLLNLQSLPPPQKKKKKTKMTSFLEETKKKKKTREKVSKNTNTTQSPPKHNGTFVLFKEKNLLR